MSFWGAHEFRHNPKNRPPKKIPHEDCTAGIKVPGENQTTADIVEEFAEDHELWARDFLEGR